MSAGPSHHRTTTRSTADMPHQAIPRVDDDGFIVGIDPHKRTLTATVLDGAGVAVGCAHFNMSGDGHRALEAWAVGFGVITRWGIEGASGYGRHTAVYLSERGHDVRDVCPNRTAERARRRRSGK